MSALGKLLELVGQGLDDLGTPWALIGGLAVSARAEPRFTRDLDLAVAVTSDAEAEAVVRHLSGRGLVPITLVEQDATGRLATVRMMCTALGSIYADALFASSGIEVEITQRAERLQLLGERTIPVARVGDLVALKLLSREADRPQDELDLRSLRGVASEEDLALARSAATLIMERGSHRGRDLPKLVTDWWNG